MIADIYEIMQDCDEESDKKIAELQAENERLKKEIAKLKCLALHAMGEFVRLTAMVSKMFAKTKGVYGNWYNPLLLTEGAIKSAYDRALRLHKAYRKAKKDLMEGKTIVERKCLQKAKEYE